MPAVDLEQTVEDLEALLARLALEALLARLAFFSVHWESFYETSSWGVS